MEIWRSALDHDASSATPFSHLKASCPLLKNVKDKASTSTPSLSKASILFAKNSDDSSDSEVEFVEISKKINRFIACNKKKAKVSESCSITCE